jgi:DNA adenine methylase
MRYYGGKGVQGKQISAIISMIIGESSDAIYLEPFCGALGVLRHVAKNFKKCYANDACKDLIMLLKEVKNGKFQNPKITKEKWLKFKYSAKSSADRAFAGFGCSYGGVWFNGYINNPTNNDMIYSSLIRLIPKIGNVTFSNKDYLIFLKSFEFGTSKKYVIYMDPPYKGTCNLPWEEFDSTQFWNIVRKLSKTKNVTVIVSEVSAPSDFKCVYKFKRRNGMHNISDKTEIEEKLYMFNFDHK